MAQLQLQCHPMSVIDGPVDVRVVEDNGEFFLEIVDERDEFTHCHLQITSRELAEDVGAKTARAFHVVFGASNEEPDHR